MESALAFSNSGVQSGTHNIEISVVGKFEVIDASHDTREVVVRGIWWLAWFANDGKHRGETLKA